MILSICAVILTAPKRIGRVASTARPKTIEIIIGGLLASGLNIWSIVAFLPYLSKASNFGLLAVGSSLTFKLKTWLLKACEEPNEARRRVARSGWEDVRS